MTTNTTVQLVDGWNLVGPIATPPFSSISFPLEPEFLDPLDDVVEPIWWWREGNNAVIPGEKN